MFALLGNTLCRTCNVQQVVLFGSLGCCAPNARRQRGTLDHLVLLILARRGSGSVLKSVLGSPENIHSLHNITRDSHKY